MGISFKVAHDQTSVQLSIGIEKTSTGLYVEH